MNDRKAKPLPCACGHAPVVSKGKGGRAFWLVACVNPSHEHRPMVIGTTETRAIENWNERTIPE